jgi:uncharacterized protein (TIGR03435 family)
VEDRRKVKATTLGVSILAVFLSLDLNGQPAVSHPEFEVATVKRSDASSRGAVAALTWPGGRITITNYSLKALIHEAYGLADYQIRGGEGWSNDVRFDVTAKMSGTVAVDKTAPQGPQKRLSEVSQIMLQNLLLDRFQLNFHWEEKDSLTYVLTVAKTGTKLKETKDPKSEPSWAYTSGGISAQNRSMTWLAEALSKRLHTRIVDETGLQKTYDFDLAWDERRMLLGTDESGDSLGPALFTALGEQLGLKLEAKRSPVSVFVIDQARLPSEN